VRVAHRVSRDDTTETEHIVAKDLGQPQSHWTLWSCGHSARATSETELFLALRGTVTGGITDVLITFRGSWERVGRSRG
jgi:hypothetical protein